jgi:GDP-L-fucose synthase
MKILVTGGTGMVGRHLRDIMPEAMYIGSRDCDLTGYEETYQYINQHKPDIVIHLAARVGGILDNIQRPAEYFDDNIIMNHNVIKACRLNNVGRFIGMLSTCVYPDKLSRYPMEESDLFLGPPAATNFSYGYAKRCLAVQIDAYNKQYGTKYNYVIPCNLYSEYDNYNHEDKMHFVTSLLKKIKDTDGSSLGLLGTGKPLRQYMYAGDLALILKLMVDSNVYDNFNICTEENLSIDDMARTALQVAGKELTINYSNTTDGQYRKDVSNKKLMTHFPNLQFTKFADGIKYVYDNINE